MERSRPIFKRLYMRRDGNPRNYEPNENIEVIEPTVIHEITNQDLINFRQQGEAFKRTQRKLAIGVVAIVGAGTNIISPPSSTKDILFNFIPPAIVQGISYLSFKNGIQIMRDRLTHKTDSSI